MLQALGVVAFLAVCVLAAIYPSQIDLLILVAAALATVPQISKRIRERRRGQAGPQSPE